MKSAPQLAGEHLDPAEEAELRRHYGIAEPGISTTGAADAGTEGAATDDRGREPAAGGPGWLPPVPPPATARHESADLHGGRADHVRSDDGPADDRLADDLANTAVMAAPTQEIPVIPPPPAADAEHDTAPADGGMTRSEERLSVGTERVATTRARLVKYVVTEEVQITVPIRREEIRVEEVPLDAPDPGPGESLTDDQEGSGTRLPTGPETADGLPEEIVLHTERPVISVEVVPVERVRLRYGDRRGSGAGDRAGAARADRGRRDAVGGRQPQVRTSLLPVGDGCGVEALVNRGPRGVGLHGVLDQEPVVGARVERPGRPSIHPIRASRPPGRSADACARGCRPGHRVPRVRP